MKNVFLKSALILFTIGGLLFVSCQEKKKMITKSDLSPWNKMKEIVESVKEPVFPDKTFSVLDYGAIGDGVFNNTQSFKAAIEACSKDGGGKVVVPSGKFLSGAIHLESNVNLHLEEGSEILFSTDTKDYYPLVHTSFEGTELMTYSPLIYAYNKENIAITGKGTLNGQADNENWWPWKGKEIYGWEKGMPSQKVSLSRQRLVDMAEKGIAVSDRIFGDGGYLRPSFVQPFECTNFLIQDIKIINAPFWVIHPMKTKNIIVDGVNIDSHGPNNDGCDPEYSKNVIIKNCIFNTGDDCIAIKSGRNADGRRVAIKSENIVIQNCKMIDGHGKRCCSNFVYFNS
jgi:polygalacturonase